MSSKEMKSKAGVRTKRDILSTKIKTLGSSAARLGVDDQGGEKRGRGKGLLKGNLHVRRKGKRKHTLKAAS